MHQELSGYRACILKLQNKNSQTSTAKLCCLLPALKMGLLLSRSLLSRQHWKIVSFQMVNQLTSSSSSSYNIHIYIYIQLMYLSTFFAPQLFLWNPFFTEVEFSAFSCLSASVFSSKMCQGISSSGHLDQWQLRSRLTFRIFFQFSKATLRWVFRREDGIFWRCETGLQICQTKKVFCVVLSSLSIRSCALDIFESSSLALRTCFVKPTTSTHLADPRWRMQLFTNSVTSM